MELFLSQGLIPNQAWKEILKVSYFFQMNGFSVSPGSTNFPLRSPQLLVSRGQGLRRTQTEDLGPCSLWSLFFFFLSFLQCWGMDPGTHACWTNSLLLSDTPPPPVPFHFYPLESNKLGAWVDAPNYPPSPHSAWFSGLVGKEDAAGVQSSRGAGEYGYALVFAGVGHLETLIEVDIRYMFSIAGLDGVLELWFQIRNW